MVRIIRMQMKGFKSFANKTEILFGEKFNCVLGPNGSGKSNILDSLCFVLGKAGAKGLRAEKSANLIYNGGKSKKAAKEGVVSIWFSNEDDLFQTGTDEVKLTRIIRQSGQGVYKINDVTMTRQQILELLSRAKINPDGYNIILQGDIIGLVEMSTTERRKIIEEIAGISIYEEKKEKALRELNRVEERLNEADIILAERKVYLQELKAERDQAQKFKELDDKIKRNKATLLHDQLSKKRAEAKKFEEKMASSKKKIAKYQEEIDKLRDMISEKRKLIEDINREVEEKGEKEQVALHKEVETLKVDLAVNKQRVSTLNAELQKISDRKKELEKSFGDLNSKIKILEQSRKETEKQIAAKEKEIALIDSRVEQFRKKHKIGDAADIDKRIEEIDKEADAYAENIAKLREEQQNLLRERDRYELRLQGIDEKIQKVLGLEKEHKGQLEELKKKKENFKQATLELSKCLSEDSSLAAQIANARTKLLARQEELSKLQGQQTRMRESIAGGAAINAILGMKKKTIHGLVSDLGHVKKQYSLALETAAGGRIKSIVVDNDQVAAECINHLKKNRLGVATFLPLNKLRAPIIDSQVRNIKGNGVHGLAVDLLTYDSKYAKVFQYVFASTLVVDDIETARRIGVGKVRMVTLTGDLVETSGAMQGGHRHKTQGAGFQEKELSTNIEKLQAEIADLQAVISRVTQEKSDNEEAIHRLREHKATLEGEIIKLEKSLHLDSADIGASNEEKKRLTSELKDLDEKYDEIVAKVSSENKKLAMLKIEKQQLREKITALRSPAMIAELNSFDEKKAELKEQITKLSISLKTSESQQANILGPEGENIQKILKQHKKEEEDFKNELKELKSLISTQEKELKDKEKAEKAFYNQFKELFNKRSKYTDEANKAENQIMLKNEDVRKEEMLSNTSSLELARIKAETAGIEEEFKEFEGVPLFKDKPIDQIKREITQFKNMVEQMGAVNMKALEIYETVEHEYDVLMGKKEGLSRERENVLVMINEVDAKKKELFMKTYDVVNENFKRLFKTLSTKGEATLELENPKDVFEGGMTLKVKLSTKKFMDIRSLSGGEKTMTALAFIFSVQEHEPAPFYIMDEVDAALDKKNSERLAKLVRSYSDRAQYIIISHNDGVITEADTLFGISMNEHGMSKVTSLKI